MLPVVALLGSEGGEEEARFVRIHNPNTPDTPGAVTIRSAAPGDPPLPFAPEPPARFVRIHNPNTPDTPGAADSPPRACPA